MSENKPPVSLSALLELMRRPGNPQGEVLPANLRETGSSQPESFTPTGLANKAIMTGSTHEDSAWDENEAMNSAMRTIKHETLKSKGRNTEDIKNRLSELEQSSVVVYRLENNGRNNENVDTIAEIGLSVVNALLKGQHIIVSIDDGMREGFSDAYSQAQFEAFLVMMGHFADKFSKYLTIHYGNDLNELGNIVTTKVHNQNQEPWVVRPLSSKHGALPPLDPADKPWVVVTGTGDTDIDGQRNDLFAERVAVKKAIKERSPGSKMSVLTEGAQAVAWNEAHNAHQTQQAELFRNLSLSELDRKMDADALVVLLHNEATTISGTNEVPWFIANLIISVTSGEAKDVIIMIEEFSAVDHFTKKALQTLEKYNNQGEEGVNQLCKTLGLSRPDLESDSQAVEVLRKIANYQPVQLAEVASTILGESELFKREESAQKARTTMITWLDRLQTLLPPEVSQRLLVKKNVKDLTASLDQVFIKRPEASIPSPQLSVLEPARITIQGLEQLFNGLEAQAPLLLGNAQELKSKLERTLGLPTGSIVLRAYNDWDGPNTVGRDVSRLDITLAASNNRGINLLTVTAESYNSDPNSARFTVDAGQLQAAVNRHLKKTSSGYTSGASLNAKDYADSGTGGAPTIQNRREYEESLSSRQTYDDERDRYSSTFSTSRNARDDYEDRLANQSSRTTDDYRGNPPPSSGGPWYRD